MREGKKGTNLKVRKSEEMNRDDKSYFTSLSLWDSRWTWSTVLEANASIYAGWASYSDFSDRRSFPPSSLVGGEVACAMTERRRWHSEG